MLNFIKYNMKSLILQQRNLFILLVLVQVFSVIVITFSYGVVNNYNVKVDEAEGTSLMYETGVKLKDELEREGIDVVARFDLDKVYSFFGEILPVIENKLDYFFVLGILGDGDGTLIFSSNGYSNRKLTVSTQLKERTYIKSGENFNEKDMNSSEKIVLASKDLAEGTEYVVLDGDRYAIKGVLGTEGMDGAVYVPYYAIPKKTEIKSLSLILKKPLLESEHNYIGEKLTKYFGNLIHIPEFDGVNNESNNKVYRDIMVITVLLIFVCALNYCIIYRYLLEKRRRVFAVTRMCGCSKYKAGIVYMTELLSISVITLLAGQIIYDKLILSEATAMFEYIGYFYGISTYIKLSLIYVAVLFAAYTMLVVKFVRKTPASLIREV